MSDIVPTIREYLASTLRVTTVADLSDDYPLVARGVVDSIELMQVVEFLEGTYGISIGETEVVPENLGTLAAMAALVQRKIASSRQS